jgi:hypothetical protein
MKTSVVVLVVLTVTGVACAQQSPVDAAINRLARIDRFAFGPTGYAAKTSEGENYFRVILADPSPITRFEKLYAIGNIQAKCYALVGIRKLDNNRFQQLVASLESPNEEVITQYGCIISHEPFSEVIKRIVAGVYPLHK